MRISDWSSDVCSSDLLGRGALIILEVEAAIERRFRLDPRIIEPLDIPEMGVGIDGAHRRVSLHQRHQADQPPSIITAWPVMNPESSAARSSASAATTCGR